MVDDRRARAGHRMATTAADHSWIIAEKTTNGRQITGWKNALESTMELRNWSGITGEYCNLKMITATSQPTETETPYGGRTAERSANRRAAGGIVHLIS
jgi:hypothetical protein